MKSRFLTFALCLSLCAAASARAESQFQNFITVRGDQLFDGEKQFRFISWNIPNLHLVEDNLALTATNAWRLPDKFEITDALSTLVQLGGTVARTYSISVVRDDNPPAEVAHVLGPGKFNENAFRSLDMILQSANEQGVRLIIPLGNNWPWMGGRIQYAAFRGKKSDEFWTDPQLIADFEETVKFVLTRTNTLTGVRYLDDKSVLCWETGNEVRCPVEWTRIIAAYIKSVDTNHLVMDGFDSRVRPEVLAMPEVDIITTHQYPSTRSKKTFAEQILTNAAMAKGKKPYIVGEFGFVKTPQMVEALKAISNSSAVGGMLWSLRFRNRDGGFYWHSEPDGGNMYKAFHWPASPMGDPYDESNLISQVREMAFAIRGLPVPKMPVPQPPALLPIVNPSAISWQGSVGANTYQVERAPNITGPWEVAGSNIDEAFTQYRPQFVDENVHAGEWFYRVRAGNDSGISEPSNIVGPVRATVDTMADELADFSKVDSHSDGWHIVNRDCRAAGEDAHRAAGVAGDTLVYKVPAGIAGFRVFALFPKNVSQVKFFTSTSGTDFQEVPARKHNYFHGLGDYRYWQPVVYEAENQAGGKFLKIQLDADTQIGRVEIFSAAPAK